MKKLYLIFIIAMLLLSACNQGFTEYPFKQNFEDWSGLEPIIKNIDGELFGDMNITADGRFTGSERVGIFGDMLYCNDNGSTIWFDPNNDNLYRLSNGQKTKMCQNEKCRSDIDGECTHMPIYNYLYSDGFLYFTYGGYDYIPVEYEGEIYGKKTSQGVFVYRYNVDTYEIEKLMEFQGIECCEMVLNGRYLYAMTYTWEMSDANNPPRLYKADYSITRIDLYHQNAVVVYSDLSNRDDFDKISEYPNQFKFTDDKIVMPVNNQSLNLSSISMSSIDMNYIITLIEFEHENIRNIYLYDNDIYFMSEQRVGYGENTVYENRLCRVNIEMYGKYLSDYIVSHPNNDDIILLDSNKREILHRNIGNFCIDGEYLYYTFTGDTILYRINLDYSREFSFNSSSTVYTPEQGESFHPFDWKVCGGYLYAIAFTEDGSGNSGWRFRQKLYTEQKPYLFYKQY